MHDAKSQKLHLHFLQKFKSPKKKIFVDIIAKFAGVKARHDVYIVMVTTLFSSSLLLTGLNLSSA